MIEVNEYVRTKKGSIDKVINPNYYMSIYVECEKGMYLLDNVVKHSKQLIDLIKVGDIVNSCIVVGFGYECVNGNKEKSILVEGKYTKVNFALLNWDIETILTKERYMANCYKSRRRIDMLKIRDDVDLKELEKFGFEYDEDIKQ